jgi:hypothetical protein
MMPNIFSTIGYASVALWTLMLLLWGLHAIVRPRRCLCHLALVVGVAAYVLAVVNSRTYVNRIQVDRSEELAAAQSRIAAARKTAEEARAGEVAQVRFAEDNAADFLDEGGMDDADRKYMATFDESVVPEWKKEKKTRSATPKLDDSLDAMLDASSEEEKGVDAGDVEKAVAEPIMMPEKQVMLANRLDGLNLKLIRWLIAIGLGVVALDYLKRMNRYDEAYLPLPLPSRWVNGLTPLPAVRMWPRRPRRTMLEELGWLLRRGDTFLYLTDDSKAAARLPERTRRLSWLRLGLVDIIHVGDDLVAPDFVFETLWYGRSSFVVDSAARSEKLLARIMALLEARKASRAHVRQTVHVVWDLQTPPREETVAEFEPLGRVTGFALVMRG